MVAALPASTPTSIDEVKSPITLVPAARPLRSLTVTLTVNADSGSHLQTTAALTAITSDDRVTPMRRARSPSLAVISASSTVPKRRVDQSSSPLTAAGNSGRRGRSAAFFSQ